MRFGVLGSKEEGTSEKDRGGCPSLPNRGYNLQGRDICASVISLSAHFMVSFTVALLSAQKEL